MEKVSTSPQVLQMASINSEQATEHVTAKEEKKTTLKKFLFKNVSFKINKPLLPLKIALFLWFGAAAVIQIFFMVNLKQKGLTIAQISLINTITPVVQWAGPTVSGIVADKLGKAKPVLFAHFFLVLIFANAILLVPDLKQTFERDVELTCRGYAMQNKSFHNFNMTYDTKQNCSESLTCRNSESSVSVVCLSSDGLLCLSADNYTTNFTTFCDDTPWYMKFHTNEDIIIEWSEDVKNCSSTCFASESDDGNFAYIFILNLIVVALYYTTLSNIFRFFDVTSMYMVKAHNSDFGRERFWSVVGLLVVPPFAGYLVEATSTGTTKNYTTSFYIFDVLVVLATAVVWKLDVQVNPPGQQMGKKTLHLVKNPDVIVFILTLLVLGMSFGFMKIFTSLYLVELGGSSMLMSLVVSVNALVGLPFLLTSNWWVEKVGSTNLLVCGLLSYAVGFLGYSFLVDPWMCLLCEVTSIFSYHLLWVSVVRHSHDIAPEGLTATVIASAGGIHYACGKGIGSLIGGMVMSRYGGRWAYRVIASMCITMAVIYSSYLYIRHLYMKKKNKTENDMKNEKKCIE